MQKQEQITTRLKEIFDIFLCENFAITNNVYFEKLITHLQHKDNAFIVQGPLAIDWIDRCITLITEDFRKVHPKVISFMLNFCSQLASNEWVLINIRERDILKRVLLLMNRDGDKFNPSIKLGCIRLLTSVASYSMGLAYIRSVRAWTFLIEYSNNEHTLYVVREARSLLYQLIYKFAAKFNDDAIVLAIFAEILKPIHENVYNVNEEIINIHVEDTELLHKLSSTLDLLLYIFQQSLESNERINITELLRTHHHIELNIWKLLDLTHNKFFIEKILTTLASYKFACLVHEQLFHMEATVAAADNSEIFNEFGLSFFNIMKVCITRVDGLTFIKLAELYHILWKKLGARAPKEILIENQRVAFENQLICFHMMLLFLCMKADENGRGEIFDNYIMKLMEISCEQTLRFCYGLRDAYCTTDGALSKLYTVEIAHKCIHSILSLERILEREHAILVCRALLYVLKEIVMIIASDNEQQIEANDINNTARRSIQSNSSYLKRFPFGSEVILQDSNIIHSVMVGLEKLIQRFKITWKESIETIGLVNCVIFVLDSRSLDNRCTVQALKLIQLAVEHFLSPNMALLVDNLEGSGLLCLGPIIQKRLHDPAWEVRDSTLELTASIADISRIKFPAFQNFLIDHKIPPIIYEMTKHEIEPFVRASAFKCLSKMVSINILWELSLSQLDLIDHLLYVLYNESEDIVRSEAIMTLTNIYSQRKIPQKYKHTMFSTLNYCIVGDHHWEVKLNALWFWRMEFKRQLTNQGMIDGDFPPVTFSKDDRKIVTLTEKEIKLRISKVLAEIQKYGYYGILLKSLKDEYALEVLNVIVTTIKLLIKRLEKHDIESVLNEVDALSPSTSENININSCLDTVIPVTTKPAILPMDIEVNFGQADSVIESILDAQDINLLQNAFDSQMGINSEEQPIMRHIDEYFYKQYVISLRQFLIEIKKLDLDKLIQEQEEWFQCTESFTSLLDDILHVIKLESRKMVSDCY